GPGKAWPAVNWAFIQTPALCAAASFGVGGVGSGAHAEATRPRPRVRARAPRRRARAERKVVMGGCSSAVRCGVGRVATGNRPVGTGCRLSGRDGQGTIGPEVPTRGGTAVPALNAAKRQPSTAPAGMALAAAPTVEYDQGAP